MTSVQQGTLRLAGGSLFYRSCGRGRPLLILSGGDADAEMTDPLRRALTERFRVITLDRRGLSRSTIEPGAALPTLETHTDDASRLLAELTDEPACVFGSGVGALIGLDLLARQPEQVRMLVAHEPPSAELLSEEQQAAMTRAEQVIRQAFRDHGVAAAMRRKAEFEGVDPEDREPDASPPAMTPQRERNLAFLLASDAMAMSTRLNLAALDVQARKIVFAAGRSSRRTLLYRCSAALAETLERPLVEFPGGHTGWLLRPRAFGAQLLVTFASHDGSDRRSIDGFGVLGAGRGS